MNETDSKNTSKNHSTNDDKFHFPPLLDKLDSLDKKDSNNSKKSKSVQKGVSNDYIIDDFVPKIRGKSTSGHSIKLNTEEENNF